MGQQEPNKQSSAPTNYGKPQPAPLLPNASPVAPAHIPFVYPNSCAHPENDNQDNLCAESRAADAADRQAFWAAMTFVIALFGTVAVVATLKYTAKAANAAKIAADALPALERAHIFIEIGGSNIASILAHLLEFDASGASLRGSNIISTGNGSVRPDTFDDGEHIFVVRFRFINHGKTPAIIKEVSASLDHLTTMNEPSYVPPIPILTDIVVPSGYQLGANHTVTGPDKPYIEYVANNGIPLSYALAIAVKEGRSTLWFCGRIIYDDVFGTEHITPWWRKYHVAKNRLVWHGDPKYNQRS